MGRRQNRYPHDRQEVFDDLSDGRGETKKDFMIKNDIEEIV